MQAAENVIQQKSRCDLHSVGSVSNRGHITHSCCDQGVCCLDTEARRIRARSRRFASEGRQGIQVRVSPRRVESSSVCLSCQLQRKVQAADKAVPGLRKLRGRLAMELLYMQHRLRTIGQDLDPTTVAQLGQVSKWADQADTSWLAEASSRSLSVERRKRSAAEVRPVLPSSSCMRTLGLRPHHMRI